MILLIGSEGSMGKRYQAILNHLYARFHCQDIGINPELPLSEYSKFIVATPTDTHFRFVHNLVEYKKPILVEKPLSKNQDEFLGIINSGAEISMMMQYQYFDRDYAAGTSRYDYFRHGKDGLVWDCFQIIALARYEVVLDDKSPIWRCALNGQEIDFRQMDRAYIWALSRFLDGYLPRKEQLIEWHLKVMEFEEKWQTTPRSA